MRKKKNMTENEKKRCFIPRKQMTSISGQYIKNARNTVSKYTCNVVVQRAGFGGTSFGDENEISETIILHNSDLKKPQSIRND